mmetsp:Transcript_3852/g.10040  ORF Transcript_3852/g.10040 Transcript_3852/m.10040 type:complete len:235 (-) Transcript_3852:91-795(-)
MGRAARPARLAVACWPRARRAAHARLPARRRRALRRVPAARGARPGLERAARLFRRPRRIGRARAAALCGAAVAPGARPPRQVRAGAMACVHRRGREQGPPQAPCRCVGPRGALGRATLRRARRAAHAVRAARPLDAAARADRRLHRRRAEPRRAALVNPVRRRPPRRVRGVRPAHIPWCPRAVSNGFGATSASYIHDSAIPVAGGPILCLRCAGFGSLRWRPSARARRSAIHR